MDPEFPTAVVGVNRLPTLKSVLDWARWIEQVQQIAKVDDLWKYIDITKQQYQLQRYPPKPGYGDPHFEAKYTDWKEFQRAYSRLRMMIVLSLAPEVEELLRVIPASNHELLLDIKTQLIPSEDAYKRQLTTKWALFVFKDVVLSEVRKYINTAANFIYEMIAAGVVHDDNIMSYIVEFLKLEVTEGAQAFAIFQGQQPSDATSSSSQERSQGFSVLGVSVQGGSAQSVPAQGDPTQERSHGDAGRCAACKAFHSGVCLSAVKTRYPGSPVPAVKSWRLHDSKRKAAEEWLKSKANKQKVREWHEQLLTEWEQEQDSW
ncbi:hypothetical protein SEPCBS119000_002384 [Sporothrix epigloea]|uniref:Gag protein n=1 Tax=Sporothrix epigloea TaxID=1892477 RepID=A0ABP0DFW6_9PEZI